MFNFPNMQKSSKEIFDEGHNKGKQEERHEILKLIREHQKDYKNVVVGLEEVERLILLRLENEVNNKNSDVDDETERS